MSSSRSIRPGMYVRVKVSALRTELGTVESVEQDGTVVVNTLSGFDVQRPAAAVFPAFLVVCDLNGVLGFRKKSKVFAKRPYVDELLAFLFKNFVVGVWTSGVEHNAVRFIDDIFGPLQTRLLFRMYRDECTPNPTTENKYGTIKDLRMVWAKFNGAFDETNTIIIDDSEGKCSHRTNALCPTPYQGEEGNDVGLQEIKATLAQVLHVGNLEPLHREVEVKLTRRSIASAAVASDDGDDHSGADDAPELIEDDE